MKNLIFTPLINKIEIIDISNISPVPKSGCSIINPNTDKAIINNGIIPLKLLFK